MCLAEMQPARNVSSPTSIHVEDDLDVQCYDAYCVGTIACDDAKATQWLTEQITGGMIISRSSGRCLEVNRVDTPYVEDGPEVSLPPQGKRLQTGICQV